MLTPRDWCHDGCLMRALPLHADAGIFCAFSPQDVAEISVARLHIFSRPALKRDQSYALRIQLCAERPDQIEEMECYESSAWGKSLCVAASQKLYLRHGIKFEVRYGEQVAHLTWVGVRVNAEFTMTPTKRTSRRPPPDDPDQRGIFNGLVSLHRKSNLVVVDQKANRRVLFPAGES